MISVKILNLDDVSRLRAGFPGCPFIRSLSRACDPVNLIVKKPLTAGLK